VRSVRLLTAACCLALPLQAQTNPLDALTAREHWVAYEVLRASGRLDSTAQFLYEGLREPPKAEVLAWRPGATFRREALVHVVQSNRGYEATVDLVGERLLDWREVTDRQYMMTYSEAGAAAAAALAHPDFRAGLTARGITDLTKVDCFPQNNGYFDLPEERGRRLGPVTCQDMRGVVSGWGSPIDGLVAIVDLQTAEVLRVVDSGPRPRTPLPGEHHPEAVGPTRAALPPIVVSQPQGAGFTREGGEVSWEGWRFHFRLDPRRGIVLSQVRHTDGDRERSVLYEASLSELFVPYQSPELPWNYQSYYDLGTYPAIFGGIASSLEPGQECPAHAQFINYYVVTTGGGPNEVPRAACLFERPGAEPAWRHTRGEVVEARARRDLVLRMIMGAGNYDYLFDWVFKQDGSIRVVLAATGMDQTMGARSRGSADDDPAAPEDRYGRFIAPYLVAVNHSHFFSFRLDFDVDGQANSLVIDRLASGRLPESNPRRSVWRPTTITADREVDAKRWSTLDAPEFWRVVNPSVTGPHGDPVGYLLEGHGAKTLLASDDYLQRRAGFTDYTLWATPYSADELYAAGNYPTGSVAGQGLPAWTRANRPVANTDIVVWYTIGFHHVPRPEDYPVMPLELHGFDIKPFGFFSRNPAIDLPK